MDTAVHRDRLRDIILDKVIDQPLVQTQLRSENVSDGLALTMDATRRNKDCDALKDDMKQGRVLSEPVTGHLLYPDGSRIPFAAGQMILA